jgi:hypothetical protein
VKLLQENKLLSLAAGANIQLKQLSDTHLEIIGLAGEAGPAIAVTAPLLSSLVEGVQTLSIDDDATIRAGAFLTGKFRLHSNGDDVVRIQRYDDDGAVVTNSWLTVAQFRWSDAAGGSLSVSRVMSNGTDEVSFGDRIYGEFGIRTNTVSLNRIQNDAGSEEEIAVGNMASFARGLRADYILPRQENGVVIQGDLFVNGRLRYTTITPPPSPFFSNGGFASNGTKLASGGTDFTVVRESAGIYRIAFATPHPQGSGFAVSLTVQGGSTWGGFLTSSQERMDASTWRFVTRNSGGTRVDAEGSFVAWS